MAKLLTEFVGTFFYVLTVVLVIGTGSPTAVIAIGLVLMVMVYMGAHVSGGHYNPAVSTALLVAQKLSAKDFFVYVAAQLAGSVVAAFAGYAVTGKTNPVAPGAGVQVGPALIVEFAYTFAMALVVLNVAVAKKTAGNSYHGLAIGGTVIAASYAGGAVSGGAFNPAIGIGPNAVHAVLGGGSLSHVWIYVVGPVLGAIGAAFFFKLQEEAPDDEEEG